MHKKKSHDSGAKERVIEVHEKKGQSDTSNARHSLCKLNSLPSTFNPSPFQIFHSFGMLRQTKTRQANNQHARKRKKASQRTKPHHKQ